MWTCSQIPTFRWNIVSIFRVEVEIVCSTETLLPAYKSTRRYDPGDHHWRLHRRGNIKSRTRHNTTYLSLHLRSRMRGLLSSLALTFPWQCVGSGKTYRIEITPHTLHCPQVRLVVQLMWRIGYGLDGRGWIPGKARFLSSPKRSHRLWGLPSLLPIHLVPVPFTGLKWPGREDKKLASSCRV